ncbi:MAG: hypothetical protein JWO84_743 [Parcubacteria group bacterium]|nr:hypothetical protein [Parcubacteria group bacterium]
MKRMEQPPESPKGLMGAVKTALRPLWRLLGFSALYAAAFDIGEHLTQYRSTRRTFKEKMGYDLDLAHPKSLNEKIVWKKLYDRNPLLVPTSDKYAVRAYVEEVLGAEGTEILVPLHAVVEDARAIPFDTLPEEYIIKTNHDSGGNYIKRAGEPIDRAAVIRTFTNYLRETYGVLKHEWAYSKIRDRKILVEKLLRNEENDLAQDYKFHVFHGVCRFIHTTPKINGVRTGRRSLFDPAWKQFPVGWKHPQGPYVSPPPQLAEMIALAEKLAQPFDYVRVDLYNANGRIYFGELTHYHGSGTEKFIPESFDFEAGRWWNAVRGYWKHNEHGT